MTHRKAIWLTYDFGLKGDFTGLFTFLDNKDAIECGSGVAFFFYPTEKEDWKEICEEIMTELKLAANISTSDRIYIIVKDYKANLIKGTFVNGARKQSPWEGFGNVGDSKQVDSE